MPTICPICTYRRIARDAISQLVLAARALEGKFPPDAKQFYRWADQLRSEFCATYQAETQRKDGQQ